MWICLWRRKPFPLAHMPQQSDAPRDHQHPPKVVVNHRRPNSPAIGPRHGLARVRRGNRGELWTVSSGVYPAKPRPAIIVQDDLFSKTASVVVIPLTTTVTDTPISRVAVPNDETTTITEPSFAMIDKITTVRRSNLGARIGRAPSALMADVERSLMVFLGRAR